MKKNFILLDPGAAGGAAGNTGGAGGGSAAGGDDAAQKNLSAAIEKARLEERTKLQGQITDLTTKAASFQEQVTALAAEKARLETELGALQTTHEALKAGAKPEGGVDIEKAIQTAVTAALGRQGPALQAEIATLRKQLEEESNKRQKAELAQLRARLINEAGGATVLIPELVVGNTEQELLDSLEHSKQVMQRVIGGGGSAAGGGGSTATAGNGNPPPSLPGSVPAAGGSAAGGTQKPGTGGRLSMKDYAAQRDALKAQALARLTPR